MELYSLVICSQINLSKKLTDINIPKYLIDHAMISFYGDLITRDIPHEMKRCFFEIYQKMSYNDHSLNDVSSPIHYLNFCGVILILSIWLLSLFIFWPLKP